MRRGLLAIALLLAIPAPACAGAWTQEAGHWQIIGAVWASLADQAFDGHGVARLPVGFHKALFQTATEYGWNDRLTLLLDTETAYADVRDSGAAAHHAVDNAVEVGARYRLSEAFGILSVQASYKSAGAFNFSVAANSGDAGRQAELRLLYGTGFTLWGDDGFADAEAGLRFLGTPRPDETPIDLTAGLWLDPNDMVMLQSFNLISAGHGAPPYGSYRSHKLEASGVRRLNRHFLVQVGAFFSPFGLNALREEGVSVALWTQL